MIAPFNREADLEETIADLEALYEWHALILNQARVGVLDWPVNNPRVYMSPALKLILGYEEHELPNAFQEWVNHIHQDDREDVTNQLTRAVEDKTDGFERVHRVTKRDGSAGWILFRARITPAHGDRPQRLLGAVIDITDIRQQITDSTTAG